MLSIPGVIDVFVDPEKPKEYFCIGAKKRSRFQHFQPSSYEKRSLNQDRLWINRRNTGSNARVFVLIYAIGMEDLNLTGYETCDQIVGMKWNDCMLLAESVAQFHGKFWVSSPPPPPTNCSRSVCPEPVVFNVPVGVLTQKTRRYRLEFHNRVTSCSATLWSAPASQLSATSGKETPLFCDLCIKSSFCPRQARDKHRENSKKEWRSLRFEAWTHAVADNPQFFDVVYEALNPGEKRTRLVFWDDTRWFTKTGSGQAKGTTQKAVVFYTDGGNKNLPMSGGAIDLYPTGALWNSVSACLAVEHRVLKENTIICQDRLGTDTRDKLNKRTFYQTTSRLWSSCGKLTATPSARNFTRL
eukprot:COSAG06_NODE_1659_length_8780_cov_82.087663_4_plen_356_part_00